MPANHDRLTPTELEAIAILERAFRRPRSADVVVGIGDDAAILSQEAGNLCWTLDASVEGVHFDTRWLSLEEVGARAIEAALSDVAAMGATPVGALSGLTLRRKTTKAEVSALARGQARASRRTRCPIIGGNIARGPVLSLTTTAIGRGATLLRRDGARVGDELWLVGQIGLARAGLEMLRRKKRWHGAPARRALEAWRRPRALLVEGRGLVGRARSCIDVSDGLGGDAYHLANASRVRLVLEGERLVSESLRKVALLLEREPLALALTGGEDYALLASGPAARRPGFARRIGRVERGRGVVLEIEGRRRTLARGGFDHLR